ncbi:MAG TPA: hypothetical protein V6D19_18860 [Stenomitos sp.]
MNKQSLLLLICGLSIFSAHSRGESELAAVSPASELVSKAPIGAIIKNAQFTSRFVAGSVGQEEVVPVPLEEFIASPGAVILDFQPDSGFPAAVATTAEDGRVATAPGVQFTNPAVLRSSLGIIPIKSDWLPSVEVQWMPFNIQTKLFDSNAQGKGGVYPVVNPARGTEQGLIAVPANVGDSQELIGGAWFTPKKAVAGFCCLVGNTTMDHTVAVAAFDKDGSLLFWYDIGVPSTAAVYYGIRMGSPVIASVWIGQIYPMDGSVIEGIGFLPN